MATRPMRWASICGTLLAIAALIFVGRRLTQHASSLEQFAQSPRALLTIASAAIGYGLSNLLLSSAWHRIMVWCGEETLEPSPARAIFARSQLAKYVPGNIFHLAGRQLLGRDHGLRHRTLAASAFLEAWGLVTAALTIALIGHVLAPGLDLPMASGLSIGFLVAALGACLAIPWLLGNWSKWGKWGKWGKRYHASEARSDLAQSLVSFDLLQHARLDQVSALAPIVLRYLAFFSVSGAVLGALSKTADPSISLPHLMTIGALAAIAWIGGYLTPGAPAGLGIREVILATTLTPIVGAGEALAVTAAFRIATTLGDLLFWAFGRFGASSGGSQRASGS